ncbi:MAG: DUF362 domain-containing protein [bacterium]
MTDYRTTTRRDFLKTSLLGGLTAATSLGSFRPAFALNESARKRGMSRVALNAGDDRADNVFQGLKVFERQIKDAIGGRRIVLKPNNVSIDRQLAASHVDCLGAILEFLKSIGETDIIIAESPATGSALDGFEHFGYYDLAKKYKIEFVDLDKADYELNYVIHDADFHPHEVRLSRLLLDPDNFIISSAVLKTHDRVVTTLSLKNIVFGAPLKDEGWHWGIDPSKGLRSDKPTTHGGGPKGINYNLFALAPRLHPDLSIIDGFEGMEGNGPSSGTPVDHRVAVVSTDWLAADRVGVELMGVDFSKVGYLNYCAMAKMGEADLNNIEVVGARISDHIKSYKLHDNVEKQFTWMTPNQG